MSIHGMESLGLPKGPQVFQKEKRDAWNEGLGTARDIGRVRLNHSRLNLFASMNEGDEVDNFRFEVASPGKLRIGTWSDPEEGIRIRIRDRTGRVIADSREGMGRASERYASLRAGNERMKPGHYFAEVTRAKGTPSTEVPYSLQLQMGDTVEHDYETTEYKAVEPTLEQRLQAVSPSASTLHAQGAANLLAAGGQALREFLSPFSGLFGPR